MTAARKGALMSSSNVRTFYIVLAISPLLMWFFADTAFKKGMEGSWEEYLCWAFVGLFASGLLTIPLTLYGYHNRHRIDVGDEEPHNLNGVHKAAIAGAAAVPLFRIVQNWIGG